MRTREHMSIKPSYARMRLFKYWAAECLLKSEHSMIKRDIILYPKYHRPTHSICTMRTAVVSTETKAKIYRERRRAIIARYLALSEYTVYMQFELNNLVINHSVSLLVFMA